jgi:hypothetical protein
MLLAAAGNVVDDGELILVQLDPIVSEGMKVTR